MKLFRPPREPSVASELNEAELATEIFQELFGDVELLPPAPVVTKKKPSRPSTPPTPTTPHSMPPEPAPIPVEPYFTLEQIEELWKELEAIKLPELIEKQGHLRVDAAMTTFLSFEPLKVRTAPFHTTKSEGTHEEIHARVGIRQYDTMDDDYVTSKDFGIPAYFPTADERRKQPIQSYAFLLEDMEINRIRELLVTNANDREFIELIEKMHPGAFNNDVVWKMIYSDVIRKSRNTLTIDIVEGKMKQLLFTLKSLQLLPDNARLQHVLTVQTPVIPVNRRNFHFNHNNEVLVGLDGILRHARPPHVDIPLMPSKPLPPYQVHCILVDVEKQVLPRHFAVMIAMMLMESSVYPIPIEWFRDMAKQTLELRTKLTPEERKLTHPEWSVTLVKANSMWSYFPSNKALDTSGDYEVIDQDSFHTTRTTRCADAYRLLTVKLTKCALNRAQRLKMWKQHLLLSQRAFGGNEDNGKWVVARYPYKGWVSVIHENCEEVVEDMECFAAVMPTHFTHQGLGTVKENIGQVNEYAVRLYREPLDVDTETGAGARHTCIVDERLLYFKLLTMYNEAFHEIAVPTIEELWEELQPTPPPQPIQVVEEPVVEEPVVEAPVMKEPPADPQQLSTIPDVPSPKEQLVLFNEPASEPAPPLVSIPSFGLRRRVTEPNVEQIINIPGSVGLSLGYNMYDDDLSTDLMYAFVYVAFVVTVLAWWCAAL